MKKLLSLFLIFLFIFTAGCSSSNTYSDISSEIISVSSKERTSSETPSSSIPTPVSSNTSSTVTLPPSKPSATAVSSSRPAFSSKPTSSRPTVVQRADPDTGISWDGASPIIYTYPDGTTGTVKKNGATYEAYPGMTSTVVTIEKGEWDGCCDDCGKPCGDGTNGTCAQWLMGEISCPNCEVIVPVRTCHTCGN